MIITDNTIMPDGRPFFAWKNEIAMIRGKEISLDEERKRLKELFRIFRVLEMKKEELPESGHIIIKIARSDIALNKDFKYYPEKYCEIIKA